MLNSKNSYLEINPYDHPIFLKNVYIRVVTREYRKKIRWQKFESINVNTHTLKNNLIMVLFVIVFNILNIMQNEK